jgi:hypothetical protein
MNDTVTFLQKVVYNVTFLYNTIKDLYDTIHNRRICEKALPNR